MSNVFFCRSLKKVPGPDDKTIYALASATGKAGVAILRVSGKGVSHAIAHLCHPSLMPLPRIATLRDLRHPLTHVLIDRALILFFESPHSFTGEDIVEFHIHGGRAVLSAMLECLQSMPDFRMAEPGEFTRRAFENDKMDLTEAEGLADLVDAETETQRIQALHQLDGALGKMYEDWRGRLAQSLAHLEAVIDFSDEELPSGLVDKQIQALRNLSAEIKIHLDDNNRGERLREGFSIALVGPPNAGKSSLLNVLAKREAAIVSPLAGTTRDVIEVHLDMKGFPVILADTAGLRASSDMLESEGVRRALARAEKADLKLVVLDGALWPEIDPVTKTLLTKDALLIVNKLDLITSAIKENENVFFVSARDGTHMTQLVDKIASVLHERFQASSALRGSAPLTRARHRTALIECCEHIERALGAEAADMRAEDVRLSMRALGRITGRVDVEDVLDLIFRDFCIGK